MVVYKKEISRQSLYRRYNCEEYAIQRGGRFVIVSKTYATCRKKVQGIWRDEEDLSAPQWTVSYQRTKDPRLLEHPYTRISDLGFFVLTGLKADAIFRKAKNGHINGRLPQQLIANDFDGVELNLFRQIEAIRQQLHWVSWRHGGQTTYTSCGKVYVETGPWYLNPKFRLEKQNLHNKISDLEHKLEAHRFAKRNE